MSYYPNPADLTGVTLVELAEAFVQHRGYLVDARHGLIDTPPAGRLASAALDALAVGTAIQQHLTAGRWLFVVDALAAGAPLTAVATAAGADPDEVLMHARLWADQQKRYGLITASKLADVVAVLDRVAGGAR